MTTYYYFAARYSRHPEMRAYRDQLEAAGDFVVTSRWIDCHNEELEQSFTPEALNADPARCWFYGQHDIEDLDDADVLVSFTGNGGGGKGGRHIEHGYFLASSRFRRVVIVGPRENIFHCHPNTDVYPDWATFLAAEAAAL